MKIAICSQGPEMDSLVDQRFGRCAYFVLVNDDDAAQHEAFPNPSIMASGGAGIQTAQFLVDKGVEAVLVGNVGPNALAALNAGSVKIYTGINGTVADTFNDFKEGKLDPVSDSTVPAHFGDTRGGRGGGMGGGGRGGGMGRGRGGGMGGGRGGGFGGF